MSDSSTLPALSSRAVFVQNSGQFQPTVRFRSLATRSPVTVTGEGVVFTHAIGDRSAPGIWQGHNVRMRFESASAKTRLSPGRPAATLVSYFLGNEPAKWIAGIPCWQSTVFHDAAQAVDVEVHARAEGAEYDVLVQPGGSLADLVVVFEGIDSIMPMPGGSLDVLTPVGRMRQAPPRTWQVDDEGRRTDLACEVELIGQNRFRFRVPGWNRCASLTIDPAISYSTFVEGSANDAGRSLAVDSSGAAYVVTSTSSVDFPVTPGAFDVQMSNFGDAAVFKLDPDGSSLAYATFLGGTNSFDDPDTIAIDPSGEAVVVGNTIASDFPTTPGAYSTTLASTSDAYVTRLNATGTALVFSTYFGGDGDDDPDGVAIDSAGRVVVVGSTPSLNLPTTSGAYQASKPAPSPFDPSGFITRFSPDGSELDYCTYFGGAIDDRIEDVCLGVDDSIFVAGLEGSGPTFPVTPGSYQTVAAGLIDIFVAKFDAAGALQWSALIGGSSSDWMRSLAVDPSGQVYVGGDTISFDYPTTPGAFDPTFDGDKDAFVSKFSADGSSLIYSTRIGGLKGDNMWAIALGADGSCYAMGHTGSTNFPTTPDALAAGLFQPPTADPFLVRLSNDGDQLLYGTIFGGPNNKVDDPRALAVDSHGAAYITGYTLDPDYPTTPGAFDSTLSGSNGTIVTKFDLSPWSDLGSSLPGQGNQLGPSLSGDGTLQPGSAGTLTLESAPSTSAGALVVGLSELSVPFKGGTLVPAPLLVVSLGTNGFGTATISWAAWPPGLPAGTKIYMQAWIKDPSGPKGWVASNALLAWTPVIAN